MPSSSVFTVLGGYIQPSICWFRWQWTIRSRDE